MLALFVRVENIHVSLILQELMDSLLGEKLIGKPNYAEILKVHEMEVEQTLVNRLNLLLKHKDKPLTLESEVDLKPFAVRIGKNN